MRIKLQILILLSIAGNPLVYSQVENLSALSNLAENLSQNSPEADNDTVSNVGEQTDQDSPREKKKDFTNNQYGYTGGKKFTNPPKSKFSDQALEHFGYSYFIDQPSTFAPLNNVPVPPDYLIGPDDNIKIILFGNKNKKYEIKVTRDGDIFIPEIGPLYVAGITFEDLKDLVRETINNELIGTQVSVTLGSLRAIDIFVLGAANKPGMYSVSALSTLTNAIIKSGGIDIPGSLRNIKLKRNGETIQTFDFYDLLLNGDTSNDSRLMQGDVVFIEPVGNTAGINGEINRSGIYELKDNERLSDLIRYAGNLRPKANLLTADIKRINSSNNSFDLISIDLSKKDNQNIAIQNGDVLSIYPVPNKLKNAILISGHAQEPGFYPWNKGLRINDLFNSPDDFLEMTDLNYVLIKRKDIASQALQFFHVDLEELFNNPQSKENIVLSDQDEIILFPSVLSADLITTRMLQDKYIYDEETNQMILQDTWTSLSYLRKALSEESLAAPVQGDILGNQNQVNPNNLKKYYEYSIYEYCAIPEVIAVESLNLDEESSTIINQILTSHCRQELLDPILDLINRNNTDNLSKLVQVYGNVHFPGIYPYTFSMTLADAIKAAGGQKNGTYRAEIEVSSKNEDDKSFANTKEIITSREDLSKINIQEMDTINLKQLRADTQFAEITGEVFFPGVYPIFKNETLSALIERAGGLTTSASIEAAFFQREVIKISQIERLKTAQEELMKQIILSSQTTDPALGISPSSSLSQLTTLIESSEESTERLGRLVIDLDSILNGETKDIYLEDKDFINIPKTRESVSIIGEVYFQSTHRYNENLNIEDYIDLSGGATEFADSANIYIINVDGSIVPASQVASGFFRSNTSYITPGSTIVIPLKTQAFSTLNAATDITQVIYQMAIAAAAVNSF